MPFSDVMIFERLDEVVVIIERLAHSHENEIRQALFLFERAADRDNLIENFARFEVSREAALPGEAEFASRVCSRP